jgi:hypothetical protein
VTCEVVRTPNGGTAIVCYSRRTRRCACDAKAPLLCDWKTPARKSGTCDRPICGRCATSPAAGKDLCPEHARQWEAWQAARRKA